MKRGNSLVFEPLVVELPLVLDPLVELAVLLTTLVVVPEVLADFDEVEAVDEAADDEGDAVAPINSNWVP